MGTALRGHANGNRLSRRSIRLIDGMRHATQSFGSRSESEPKVHGGTDVTCCLSATIADRKEAMTASNERTSEDLKNEFERLRAESERLRKQLDESVEKVLKLKKRIDEQLRREKG
jgi:hypothetical protein